MQPRAQVARVDDELVARRDAADDVAGERLLRACPPASRARSASACGDAAPRVEAHAGPVAGGGQAARGPRAVQPAADEARRSRASSRASARAATAATAPVRSAVTARASSSASGSPVCASRQADHPHDRRQRVRAGLPGNDVIHLSIASPPPRAGIARKSPYGGLWR